MKEVTTEGKVKLMTLLGNLGIKVEKTNLPEIYYAKCKHPFVFTIRSKEEASFRRITGKYEFGFDEPQLDEFIRNTSTYNKKFDVPSMVFFYDRKNKSIKFGDPTLIKKVGRHWVDPDYFPKGIWYIDTDNLYPINDIMRHI